MSLKVQACVAAVTGLSLAGPALGCTASAPPKATVKVVQLTGTQLAAALLPASDFPAGDVVFRAANSGNRLETGTKADLATASCGTFFRSFNSAGLGESAFASRVYSTSDLAQQFLETAYQLRNSHMATTFFDHVRSDFSRCSVATVGSNKFSVRTVSSAAVSGHPSVRLILTTVGDGQTARANVLISMAGTDVFDLINVGLQIPPPARPDPRDLMLRLISRVQSAA